ncbi:tRNA (uracil-5-) -methyltransferase [Bifidobacterium actinocoloniiforme DSM 22766]|uniref:tRNA (Uracil-5-)-methyltransferase n=1 Tax=Bifidobacterium actinocoloniiforme DSM 22766 TaxID=1437605 RepID=A0A086Z0V4_9BIFI|nr:TRAM domain-containing protein [Bifidobacterium actinocoloniiforme]AKV55346.1 RNA methyltransferase [Bifidobacterium actinocoloniiforme DSM 22766]KFI40154.1 tRNA (uracil-5-) -methyltransferase [Bifidobacterium actinocoloniiforme DSM 22766]
MPETVRVERYADQGRCVGHLDGRVIFLRFALPGELVEVSVDQPVRAKARFLTGEVTRVIEASPDRVTPAWPLAGPLAQEGGVGGADLVHAGLPAQLAWKRSLIEQQMQRMGHVDASVEVVRAPGDEEAGGLHWRTRIDLIADEQGKPSMRRRESHERVAIDAMPLARIELNDLATQLGVWRGGFEPGSSIRLALPQHERDGQDGNYALLVDDKVKAGRRKLEEHVEVQGRDFTYEVDAAGFWQIHRQAPALLADAVLRAVQGGLQAQSAQVIWDLYSGSGLFSLPLATMAGEHGRVLAVEGSRVAVAQARYNAQRAGLDSRIEALAGDVAKRITGRIPQGFERPDAVVLDPPRAGAKAAVCRLIADSGAPLVVYVACDPTSLARDTATLTAAGYQLASIQAYDLYPMTHHVETLAVFTR